MDEEIKKMLGLENDTLSATEATEELEASRSTAAVASGSSSGATDEYIPGTEAPQLVPPPTQMPGEEPEPEQKPKKRPKPGRKNPSYVFSSVLTIIGIVAVAACAFFLLTREIEIQAQRDAITEIQSSIETLYAKRDSLVTQYNSSLDLADIRERASQIGMHEPEAGQIIELGGN